MSTQEHTPSDAATASGLRAEPRDDKTPSTTNATGASRNGIILGAIGIALVGGAIGWGFLQDEPFGREIADEPEPVTTTVIEPEPVAPVPSPVREPEIASVVEIAPIAEINPDPVLALMDSDPVVRTAIDELNAGQIAEQFIAADFVVERAVAVLDNLQRGQVPYKLLPIARPSQKFQVVETDQGLIAAPANTSRYDGLAKWVDAIDSSALAALVVRFKPVAQEAYALLGYPAEDLDAAIQLAISQIATTPAPYPEAILMVKEAVYVYADESLEALPALQKQIMRMGDENVAVLRNKALAIQAALRAEK